ncbi:MAG: NAD(P)-dependent oxidoreductase [Candidatus Hinthialibacter sp.]
MRKVGFVGVGTMGFPMSDNLLKSGFDVYLYNRTTEKIKPLVEKGAKACASPAEVGENCEWVFTCVSDTPDVKQVIMEKNGVAEGIKSGGIIIDCSTSSPKLAQEMHATLKERGIGILDAPVSGGPEGAMKGTLTIMAGGDEDVFQRAMPVLEAVGKTITYIGPAGAGQLTKAVNQIVIASSLVGIAEGVALAKKCGIDPEKVIQAISGGAARSFMMDVRAPLMLKEEFEKAYFALGYHAKDLRIAMELAQEVGAKIPLCKMASDQFQAIDQSGRGALDHSAVYLYTKEENKL